MIAEPILTFRKLRKIASPAVLRRVESDCFHHIRLEEEADHRQARTDEIVAGLRPFGVYIDNLECHTLEGAYWTGSFNVQEFLSWNPDPDTEYGSYLGPLNGFEYERFQGLLRSNIDDVVTYKVSIAGGRHYVDEDSAEVVMEIQPINGYPGRALTRVLCDLRDAFETVRVGICSMIHEEMANIEGDVWSDDWLDAQEYPTFHLDGTPVY